MYQIFLPNLPTYGVRFNTSNSNAKSNAQFSGGWREEGISDMEFGRHRGINLNFSSRQLLRSKVDDNLFCHRGGVLFQRQNRTKAKSLPDAARNRFLPLLREFARNRVHAGWSLCTHRQFS